MCFTESICWLIMLAAYLRPSNIDFAYGAWSIFKLLADRLRMVWPDQTEPDRNQIPFIHSTAVVKVPFGAYPTACFKYYDYDPVYMKAYARAVTDDTVFDQFLND
jgi:hypothetical protein